MILVTGATGNVGSEVVNLLLAQGLPEDVPDRVIGFWSSLSGQQVMPISPIVEQILGRPALTFAEWAIEHAAAFGN